MTDHKQDSKSSNGPCQDRWCYVKDVNNNTKQRNLLVYCQILVFFCKMLLFDQIYWQGFMLIILIIIPKKLFPFQDEKKNITINIYIAILLLKIQCTYRASQTSISWLARSWKPVIRFYRKDACCLYSIKLKVSS